MLKEKFQILIVDDEPIARMVVAHMLENAGYRSTEAISGKGALEKLKENASIDLMILDHRMPEMSGVEVLQQIRTLFPFRSLPIIMLTAHAKKEHIQLAQYYGVVEVLHKPGNEEELLKLVANALKEKNLNND